MTEKKQFEHGNLEWEIEEAFDAYFGRFESEFADRYCNWKIDYYLKGKMESDEEIETYPEATRMIEYMVDSRRKTDRYFVVSDYRKGRKHRPVVAVVFNEDDEYYVVDFLPLERQEKKESK